MHGNPALVAAILVRWRERPQTQRRQLDAENFAEDLWDQSLRLARTSSGHFGMVMALLQGAIVRDDGAAS